MSIRLLPGAEVPPRRQLVGVSNARSTSPPSPLVARHTVRTASRIVFTLLEKCPLGPLNVSIHPSSSLSLFPYMTERAASPDKTARTKVGVCCWEPFFRPPLAHEVAILCMRVRSRIPLLPESIWSLSLAHKD